MSENDFHVTPGFCWLCDIGYHSVETWNSYLWNAFSFFGVKTSVMYEFAFTLEPSSSKRRGDLQHSEMTSPTVTEGGFWCRWTDFNELGMFPTLFIKTIILSLWESINSPPLWTGFFSQNVISSEPVPSFIPFKKILAPLSRFYCYLSANCCRVLILRGDIFRLSFIFF